MKNDNFQATGDPITRVLWRIWTRNGKSRLVIENLESNGCVTIQSKELKFYTDDRHKGWKLRESKRKILLLVLGRKSSVVVLVLTKYGRDK